MTEGDKQERRAAATLNLCPVCNRGPVRVTRDRPDGGQEGHCENHVPFRYLERDSAKEPWREAPPDAP
jgi:hypothetical protein